MLPPLLLVVRNPTEIVKVHGINVQDCTVANVLLFLFMFSFIVCLRIIRITQHLVLFTCDFV